MSYVTRAIKKDLKEIQKKHSTFFSVGPVDDDLFHWEGYIMGPPNTPYEGGAFKITIHFPPNYRLSPPKVCFRTKMYHPNISDKGSIFLDMLLLYQFNPSYTIYKVLTRIYEMLAEPMIGEGDHFVEEIARLYKEDTEAYEAKVKACAMDKEQ